MIQSYIIYNTTTGEIIRTGFAPADQIAAQAGPGETAVPGVTANDVSDRWDLATGSPVSKDPLPGAALFAVPADGTTTVDFPGLPNPATVTVTGPVSDSFTVTDGSLSLTFDTPGSYKVEINAFPYANKEIEIIAT